MAKLTRTNTVTVNIIEIIVRCPKAYGDDEAQQVSDICARIDFASVVTNLVREAGFDCLVEVDGDAI